MEINNIHPIQTAKTNWNNASGKKKVAIAAGTLAGAAAVGATVYAAVKGDAQGVKGLKGIGTKLVDGYKKLGNEIAEKFASVKAWVLDKLPKTQKAEEAVAEVAEA